MFAMRMPLTVFAHAHARASLLVAFYIAAIFDNKKKDDKIAIKTSRLKVCKDIYLQGLVNK